MVNSLDKNSNPTDNTHTDLQLYACNRCMLVFERAEPPQLCPFCNSKEITILNTASMQQRGNDSLFDVRSHEKTSITQAVVSYTGAVTNWVSQGAPTRSQEEIDKYFAICQACAYFRSTPTPHCGICGCKLSGMRRPLLNKIAMATEKCPIGKWP